MDSQSAGKFLDAISASNSMVFYPRNKEANRPCCHHNLHLVLRLQSAVNGFSRSRECHQADDPSLKNLINTDIKQA